MEKQDIPSQYRPLQCDEPATGGPVRRLLAALFDRGGSVAGLERVRLNDPANRAAVAGLDAAVLRRWTGEEPPHSASGSIGGCEGEEDNLNVGRLPGTMDPQVVPSLSRALSLSLASLSLAPFLNICLSLLFIQLAVFCPSVCMYPWPPCATSRQSLQERDRESERFSENRTETN